MHKGYFIVATILLGSGIGVASARDAIYLGARAGGGEGTEDTGLYANTGEVFGGWRVTPRFAIELGYLRRQDDGKLDAPAPMALQRDIDIDGVTLSARYDVPLDDRWTVYGRAGAGRFSARIEVNGTGGVAVLVPVHAVVEEDSTGYVLGLGSEWRLWSGLFLGAEFQQQSGNFALGCTAVECTLSKRGELRAVVASLRWEF